MTDTRTDERLGGPFVRRTALLASLLMITAGLAVTPPTAADGQTLTVDDDNDECIDANFDSVQAAVDAASAGDTVVVCAGTYEESVTIPATKDGLTLDGRTKGAQAPTIVGDGVDTGSQPHAAIHVDASAGESLSDVTIRELTLRNPTGTYGVYAGSGGSAADVTGLAVTDNTIRDVAVGLSSPGPLSGAVAGFYVRADYNGLTVANNTVENVVSNNWARPAGLSFSSFIGDKPAFADGTAAFDTVVRGNTIESIVGTLENAGYTRAKGISVSGEFDGFLAEDNTITGVNATTRALGITLTENPNGGDVDGDGADERVGPKNFQIRNNVVSGLSSDVPSSLFVGGYEDLGDDHVVTHNSLIGPVNRFHGDQPGFQTEDADRLDARENWWGSPLGPTHEDNEFSRTGLTGSSVGDFIDYEPWCESELCVAPLVQSP